MRAAWTIACLLAFACAKAPAPASAADDDAGAAISAGDASVAPPTSEPPAGPVLAGCPIFPAANAWNSDISGAAIDPHSADFLAFIGTGLPLWPGFGGQYGTPFTVVPQDQAGVPMTFLYAASSDPGPYPFPPSLVFEGPPDYHAVVMQSGSCRLYETYNTYAQGSGFHADSGALFDLATGAPRPDGWTSATAAGLPILPGLARYDEAVTAGEIRHALAFTAGATAHAYVAPATHSSGTSSATYAPPMGLRLRLKAGFDLSPFHGASLVILRGLQRYGMFLTDNAGGQFLALAGAYDSRWSVTDLDQLKTVPASAFEVVQLGTVHSGQ